MIWYSYILIIITVIGGQLFRLPSSIGSLGILSTDLAIPIFLAYWMFTSLKTPRKIVITPVIYLTILFLTFAAFSLFINLNIVVSPNGVLGSLFYYVRLVMYFMLLIPFSSWVRSEPEKAYKLFFNSLVISGTVLSLLGFIQLIVFPNFAFMARFGWDPHNGRLLSTWFDPNFLGGFLSIVVVTIISYLIYYKESTITFFTRYTTLLICCLILNIGAILSTFSRSAVLALLGGLIVIGILKARKLLLVTIIIGALALLFIPRLQSRIAGAFEIDTTSSLRIKSWIKTIEDIDSSPYIGIGYNTLKYQTVKPIDNNAGSGRDSSLLTIWLTTGLIGLILYLSIFGFKITQFMRNYNDSKLSLMHRTMALAGLSTFLLISVHAMFVNSLLYPHILIFLIMFLAL